MHALDFGTCISTSCIRASTFSTAENYYGRIDERKKEKRKLTRKKARMQRFTKQVSFVGLFVCVCVCVCVCVGMVCMDGMDEPPCL
jgi:hypothetical protein